MIRALRVPFPVGLALFASAIAASGCTKTPVPGSSYFDERIAPVLESGCASQTTGCHVADQQQRALGNLDLSSYDALQRRHDVLPAYGPYSLGLLLLKGGPGIEVSVETLSPDPISGEYFTTVTTDVRHAAGRLLQPGSTGYSTLTSWIDQGATRTGIPDQTLNHNKGSCVDGAGTAPGFDPTIAPTGPGYDDFVSLVQPVLRETCAGSLCHGNSIADLYLTCGNTDAELRWNYFVAVSHLTEPAVSASELLNRPLSTLRGGVFHEGGNIFASIDDDRYQTILSWAEQVVAADPAVVHDPDLDPATPIDPGLAFFADRVQPTLVRKGCMFMNCHSPAMFHDLRLRGGSQGHFSRIATVRNYEMARKLLALESADPNDSRLVAKNLYPAESVPGAKGLLHRGGALFEDFGSAGASFQTATLDDCAGYDAANDPLDDVPAYCVIAAWHRLERDAAIARGEVFPDGNLVDGMVWISRPPGTGDVRDFDTFRGGADLRWAPVTVNADGSIAVGADYSLLGGCGIAAGADVRNPAVSWDGTQIAFAARDDATVPLRLYWMNTDGSGCTPVPDVAAGADSGNGILIHDFDPAFAPDGRLVFASTRGNIMGSFPYSGPTRTPAELQPNANLYLYSPTDGEVRQLTFLLDQEVAPAFLADGRVVMTTEKREPYFHQLALRRENLDGGDYHPLFAQRGSVGFDSATEVTVLPNGDFAFVGAMLGQTDDGAGAIVMVNRSLGPDQDDRDPADRSFLHSMTIPVPGAFPADTISGVFAGPETTGAFRSPAALPTGHLVVSCDLSASTLAAGPYVYDLCDVDPASGAVVELGVGPGLANVEAAPIYARANHGVFVSRADEANGHTEVVSGTTDAEVHVEDFPLLGTLLFSNTRVGRPIMQAIRGFEVFEAMPPPVGTTSFGEVQGRVQHDGLGATGQLFVDNRSLGAVSLNADGSARFSFPGGAPIVLQPLDALGMPIPFGPDAPVLGIDMPDSGVLIQREQMQFYPGERSHQSIPRRFFNGLCGGCHGSITGYELDIAVDVDILTGASQTMAYDQGPQALGR